MLDNTTTAWVLTDGKIGDEVHCFGIAQALGLHPERRLVAPRALWAALAPFGPIDPRDRPARPGSCLRKPFPDIVIASGRRTVPYLRHVRRASGGRTFTVFLKDPRTGPRTADVIWVPEHDPLRGGNVLVTLTSPHPLTPSVFALARTNPDARIQKLPRPRLAVILGGSSGHHAFEPRDCDALAAIAVAAAREGRGVMVTPSRRTPPDLVETVRRALADNGFLTDRAFVWDRDGNNPYADLLANADCILVTGDSVNMVGEAAAAGVPVYVFTPSGAGHRKMTAFVDRLVAAGHVRRFAGSLDPFDAAPLDATPEIAAAIARRYRERRNNSEPV